jgi:hypothetical protein
VNGEQLRRGLAVLEALVEIGFGLGFSRLLRYEVPVCEPHRTPERSLDVLESRKPLGHDIPQRLFHLLQDQRDHFVLATLQRWEQRDLKLEILLGFVG